MTRVIAALVCTLLAGGCFSVTYRNPAVPPNGIVIAEQLDFYVFGLVGKERVPVYQYCPTGVSRIETGLRLTNLLLTVITIGIVTPRSYVLYCGGSTDETDRAPLNRRVL
jgi:hypothetical protein